MEMFCDQALAKLSSDPETSVAPYELAALFRIASKYSENTTAHAVRAEEEVANSVNDSSMIEFDAALEKVCEEELKRQATASAPATEAPTQPNPVLEPSSK
jgi:hypothetical protein